ncbi:NrtA/SsuA/CpmA family ABC transporter substrate-binding protein [Streptomyces sp. DSM 44915]|uniref:NrtA/SsuA/CpmA family ABC transporter substrate-binding protein n=1 Tax=Streptomyces chisholmiae TaxID=3075540 RepID=A0ABU2JW70_9ACTN|nr:NrtA/SsuA/CpmA family ABC transporter substrate-binding protein [Streptomyces sp. DSM 44915]MDT0268986.1 NrtA/SsuA/CpmA family ABC transporter substrate-binding protein [Streptomyces sp. DSM 44915]
MRFPRLTLLAVATALTSLTALTACGGSSGDDADGAGPTITVRIPDPGNSGVFALGKKDGSLERALAEVDAEVSWTGSAGPFAPAAQALNADQLDIATGSITSGLTSLSQNPGFAFFSATAPDHAGEGILVPDDSDIESVEDLVGRTVAVNEGGTGEYLLLKALETAGIDPDQVERVYLRPDQTAAVFNAGQVDAWAVWAAYSVAEIGSGDAHFLVDGADVGSDNYSLTAVRTGFAEDHPEVVRALFDYLQDASERQRQDPAAFLNVNTDVGPQALTGAARETQIAFLSEGGTVAAITDADIERFQDVARFYAERGVTRDEVDIAAHVLDVTELR